MPKNDYGVTGSVYCSYREIGDRPTHGKKFQLNCSEGAFRPSTRRLPPAAGSLEKVDSFVLILVNASQLLTC